MKTCTKCGIEQVLSEFAKDSRYSELRHISRCKACVRLYSSQHYQSNREKRNLQNKLWQRENADAVRIQKRKRYAVTAEQSRTYARAWYRKNHTKELSRHARYRDNNRVQLNERQRRRREAQLAKERHTVGVLKARTIYEEHRRGGPGTRNHITLMQWRSLKAYYDFRCLCCDVQEPEIRLEADHIVPLSRGGTNDVSNIQPLCRSCNAKKHKRIKDYRYGASHAIDS